MGKFRSLWTPFLSFYRADFAHSKHTATGGGIPTMILRSYIRSRVQLWCRTGARQFAVFRQKGADRSLATVSKKEGKSLLDSYVEVGQKFWRALIVVATKFPHFLEREIFFSSYVELYQVSTKRVQTVPQGADYFCPCTLVR